MNEYELDTFLTSDYIYLPYIDKESLTLRSDGYLYKNDEVSFFDGTKIFSPVSGKAYGLSEIMSTTGIKKVLVIENDFKDKIVKKPISKENIYDININDLKKILKDTVTCTSLTLSLSFSKYDIKDSFILKDNIMEVLETLNIIEQSYKDLEVKIKLDKKDITNYQTLFSYLGTYPNIIVYFDNSDSSSKIVSIYEIIDLYNKIKNRIERDYIYLTVIHKEKLKVVKTKRYSNLKDLLVHLNLMSTNMLINNKIKIENGNFLLDDTVYSVNIL